MNFKFFFLPANFLLRIRIWIRISIQADTDPGSGSALQLNRYADPVLWSHEIGPSVWGTGCIFLLMSHVTSQLSLWYKSEPINRFTTMRAPSARTAARRSPSPTSTSTSSPCTRRWRRPARSAMRRYQYHSITQFPFFAIFLLPWSWIRFRLDSDADAGSAI